MRNWTLRIARRAEKKLDRLPVKDERLISQALDAMAAYPFNGDIIHLHNERSEWRRRVGNYRIFFDVYPDSLIIDVVEIQRRTSKTY